MSIRLTIDGVDYSLLDYLKNEQSAKRAIQSTRSEDLELKREARNATRVRFLTPGAQPVRTSSESRTKSPSFKKDELAAWPRGADVTTKLAVAWFSEGSFKGTNEPELDYWGRIYCGDGSKYYEIRNLNAPVPDKPPFPELPPLPVTGPRVEGTWEVYGTIYDTSALGPSDFEAEIGIAVFPAGGDKLVVAYVHKRAAAASYEYAASYYVQYYQCYLRPTDGALECDYQYAEYVTVLYETGGSSAEDYDEGCFIVSTSDIIQVDMPEVLRSTIKSQMYFPKIDQIPYYKADSGGWPSGPDYRQATFTPPLISVDLDFPTPGTFGAELFDSFPPAWFDVVPAIYGTALNGYTSSTPVLFDSYFSTAFDDYTNYDERWFNYPLTESMFPATNRCRYHLYFEDSENVTGDRLDNVEIRAKPFHANGLDVEALDGFKVPVKTVKQPSVYLASTGQNLAANGENITFVDNTFVVPNIADFHLFTAWDWGQPGYCRERLAALGINIPAD